MTLNQNPEIVIRQITIRTHAHATEDLGKVSNVLLELVSEEFLRKDLVYEKMSGTFGQRITNISLIIKKRNHIEDFLEKLAISLSSEDKIFLQSNFERRFDQKLKFYFRIDKQLAAIGKIRLPRKVDVIQVIFANLDKTYKKKITTTDIWNYYKYLEII